MVWKTLTDGLAEALRQAGLHTPERVARIELAVPREAAHGDWTTNLALTLAKEVGQPPRALADTEVVGKAANVAVHITIEDRDDRPERMVRDPDRYFADARRRAEREVMRQADWLFDGHRHREAR